MKSANKKYFVLILLGMFLLSACGGVPSPGGDTEATEVPIVVDDFAVIAEGRLVPNESVALSFVIGGQVAEILVEEGDLINNGDIIARLGDREQFESAVAAAELEGLAAELEIASAEQELLNARLALGNIQENWPDQATLAQQALKDARQRAHDAQKRLDNLTSTATQEDIDIAFSNLVLAEDALDKIKDKFEPYEDKPEDNLTRAALQARVAQAQKAYDDAVRTYNNMTGTANEFDVSQAEAELAISQAQLAQAQEDFDILLSGPDADDVEAAEARIRSAEERISTSQGRVSTAQASLAAAQANLENLDLVATIDGTIVDLDLILGEQISPGVPVVTLVDFSKWFVETDNLTEIEVVDVSVGQKVSIVADALPDISLTGTLESIEDIFEEKRGDITYTARILVDEIDPRLRWGMTVVVTFEES